MAIPSDAYILAAAMVLAAAAPFVLRLRPHDHLTPRAWIAVVYAIVYIARPLYILHHPDRAHWYLAQQAAFPDLVLRGMAVALGGIALFWIGHSTRFGQTVGRAVPLFRGEISPPRWRQAVLGLLLIGLVAYAVILWRAGGFARVLSIMYIRGGAYEDEEVIGPAKVIVRFVGVAAVLGLHHHITVRHVRWAWPLVVFASVVEGTMGGRGAVLIQIWLVSYVLYALHKPSYRSWKALGAIFLVLVAVAVVALTARQTARKGTETVLAELWELPATATAAVLHQARGFDFTVAAIEATGRENALLEGRTYVSLIPILVPAQVWPVRAASPGYLVRKVIEPSGRGSRPPGAMGEGYMNFGLVGALASMFLLGIWSRALDVYTTRAVGHSHCAMLLSAYGLALLPKFLVGVAALAVRALLVCTVGVLAAYFWAARVEGPASNEHPGGGHPS